MRLITFEYKKTQRLGIWMDKVVLDVQTAIGHYSFSDLDEDKFVASCNSMLSLLSSSDEVWDTLTAIHDYYLVIVDQQMDSLLLEKILLPVESVILHAPLPTPGKVICIAANYPTPVISQKPDFPTVFMKPSSTITGPDMPVWITELTKNVAYEVELAVVIGKRAHNVSIAEAMQCVAGYTLANDLGDRDLESRTSQWTSGKMFDSFTPIGPWLATKDEFPLPLKMDFSTEVNGEVLQKGNLSEMFFDVPELISILSTLTTLVPGDLVLTGSTKLMDGQPNPVHALRPGERVTIKIDGLGVLSNPILKEL